MLKKRRKPLNKIIVIDAEMVPKKLGKRTEENVRIATQDINDIKLIISGKKTPNKLISPSFFTLIRSADIKSLGFSKS